MQTLIKVTVQDTESIIFQGEVDRITSYNEVGRFDVYPMHANFISIIKQQLDLYLHHQKIKELKLEQAVLKVKKDEAHVFLGIETLNLDDIDPYKDVLNAPQKK
jgi:F0F1-type ATP synthase epsilon subunit